MLSLVSSCQQSQSLNKVQKYNAPRFSSKKQNKPDSFEKQGSRISNGTKWGIGLGLAALGTVLVLALSRGKGVSSNNIKQLAEHIDFKEAKTMEEAKKFAMDNFGIKLELGDDIFTANLVNDVCTNINNRLKGEAAFPIKCVYQNLDKDARASWNMYTNTMGISKNNFSSIMLKDTNFSTLCNNYAKNGKGYQEILETFKSTIGQEAIRGMKKSISHELGHCNHFAVCKNAPKMDDRFSKLYKEFLDEINKIDTKSACSKFFENDYYKTNPAEFVAETFAWKMMGKTAPKEVEELYLKYGGIPFVA